MSDPGVFNVAQLKEFLRARGLSTTGAKAELAARLMEADPSGDWMTGQDEDDVDDGAREGRTQREMELCRREKEIAERELRLAQREIAMLRESQGVNSVEWRGETTTNGGGGTAETLPRVKLNLTVVADLLASFDGISGDFDTWERQLKLLKVTYQLGDDHARILVGMRLKGKALEWFHSRPEFIGMSFDALIDELRLMFRHRRSRMTIRRTFEARVWKKDETFREYMHEKIIMGNHVPVEADEMIDYIIDGIPDNALRNQARIQRFTETESLLRSFEAITLRDHVAGSSRSDGRGGKSATSERDSEIGRIGKKENMSSGEKKKTSVKRCFNCGVRDHISANCPSKNLGSKCFECGEFGHIASRCSKKKDAPKSSCAVTHSSCGKYTKDVVIDDTIIEALIDTGSDISLMRADEYVKMGSPRFQEVKIRFSGIGSGEITALGEFQAKITVDGNSYPILVVSDTCCFGYGIAAEVVDRH